MPLLPARNTSRSNSLGVRLVSLPSTFTLWLATSMVSAPKRYTSVSSGSLGMVRASTAFTRATSSRGLKGFTT